MKLSDYPSIVTHIYDILTLYYPNHINFIYKEYDYYPQEWLDYMIEAMLTNHCLSTTRSQFDLPK